MAFGPSLTLNPCNVNTPTTDPVTTIRSRFGRLWVWPAVAVAALLAWRLSTGGGGVDGTSPATTVVERGPLTISVLESGTIRPRRQVILRNEMDEDSTILFIVKEGTLVSQGELLVELDATVFENERVERRIRVQNGEAALVYAQENFNVITNQAQADIEQAELLLRFADLDLEKYLKGEHPKQLKELQARITLAEAELGRADEDVRWSQILFKEKYLSQSDLQQDELASKKARLDVELAREELGLATNYTHFRQVTEFRSAAKQAVMALERMRRKAVANIAQARAEVRAREAQYLEDKERLRRVEAEIAKAKIVAPIDGMVLYASSVSSDWDDEDPRIQIGALVDERREIIHLPTAAEYDVDIRVPEVALTKLRPNLPARILVDALAGQTLSGRVTTISSLPDSRSRFLNPNLKLYNTVIELDPAPMLVRNGMSCRVEVIVDRFPNTLYVPMQAVVQVGGQPTVFVVVEGGVLEPAPVQLGLDNNRVVQILAGLTEGQTILLTPPLHSPSPGSVLDPPAGPSTNNPSGKRPELTAVPGTGSQSAALGR